MPGRLFLTGFMGCGKTTTGRLLASALGQPFVDLDERVETAAGMDLRRVFETRGEEAFRRLESEVLENTLEIEDAVVATGGGILTLERNRSWMHKHGLSIWLHLPFSAIAERLGEAGRWGRPLFRDEDQALELYRRRLPLYREADLTLDIDSAEDMAAIAERIILMLGDRACTS